MSIKIYKWPETINLHSLTKEDIQFIPDSLEWIVTEKIDGTNIGLNIYKDSFIFNSRNNIRGPKDSFYNIYMNVDLIKDVIVKIQERFFNKDSLIERIILYGEYFGKKIMNRIDYKIDYAFRFFNMQIVFTEGYKVCLSFKQFLSLFKELELEQHIVPIIGIFKSFKEASLSPNCFCSFFNKNETMEGIVIQPYNKDIYSDSLILLFKNKSKDFEEKSHRVHSMPSDFSKDEIQKVKSLKEIFKLYCTESRMYSVISKMDKPKSVKEFKNYIKPFLEDAYKEFKDDHRDIEITDKEKKIIMNVGSDVFVIFNKIVSKLEK